VDTRIEKLAEVLVDYSTAVRPGDKVVISGSSIAEPLLKAIYTRVLQTGGNPYLLVGLEGTQDLFYKWASDTQLQFVPPPARLVMETYDVRISIIADANTKALTRVDPAKLVLRDRAWSDIMKVFMKRAASGELRWVLAPFPTNAFAQDAEMSLEEYEDFVYGSCLPDPANPVKYWQDFSRTQQRIVDWLNNGRSAVHVTGPDVDLHLKVDGRKWKNSDGRFNMPDGEVFTGPVEDSVEGHVRFSYPTIEQGREVTGVHLWFEHGRVVKATADKNEEFLLKTIDTDAGARSVGEFAIGTNEGITRFTRQILFDEKINGSFHMALGASYPETGGKNESAIHWDMICDLRRGGEVRVDSTLVYREGKFVI